MRLSELTAPEVRMYIRECNFTNDEMTLYSLRVKGETMERCAEYMNISTSTAYRLSDKVKKKMQRIGA